MSRIPFVPSSGAISMDDMRKFFGDRLGSNIALGDYYRGGSYVRTETTGTPNNSGVPTSGAIDLADFRNSFTTISFTSQPASKSGFGFGNDSVVLNFNRGSDWEMGYGPDMENGVDYQLTHTTTLYQVGPGTLSTYQVSFGGVTRDLKIAGNRSQHTFEYTDTYTPSTGAIHVTVAMTNNGDCDIQGSMTLTARHAVQTGYTVTSSTFTYYINHSGGT